MSVVHRAPCVQAGETHLFQQGHIQAANPQYCQEGCPLEDRERRIALVRGDENGFILTEEQRQRVGEWARKAKVLQLPVGRGIRRGCHDLATPSLDEVSGALARAMGPCHFRIAEAMRDMGVVVFPRLSNNCRWTGLEEIGGAGYQVPMREFDPRGTHTISVADPISEEERTRGYSDMSQPYTGLLDVDGHVAAWMVMLSERANIHRSSTEHHHPLGRDVKRWRAEYAPFGAFNLDMHAHLALDWSHRQDQGDVEYAEGDDQQGHICRTLITDEAGYPGEVIVGAHYSYGGHTRPTMTYSSVGTHKDRQDLSFRPTMIVPVSQVGQAGARRERRYRPTG